MRRFLSLVLLLSTLPAVAWAQDAGDLDAGDDGGEVYDAGPVPDASAPDPGLEQCLDGYPRSDVDACAGKSTGDACTFAGGEAGQCAALRCVDGQGQAILICVASTGQPAPPATYADGGLIPRNDAGAAGAVDEAIQGGGCAASPASPGLALGVFVCALVWARRRTIRA